MLALSAYMICLMSIIEQGSSLSLLFPFETHSYVVEAHVVGLNC